MNAVLGWWSIQHKTVSLYCPKNHGNCLWNTQMEFEQYMLKVKHKFKRNSQVLESSKSPCSIILCETSYFHYKYAQGRQVAWALCWVGPFGTLLWKHRKLPWPGRLKVAARPKHLWQQQLLEQQAEPGKRRGLTGNICTWSLASSLIIIKDEGRQTDLGAGQSTPVWIQEGKITAWGDIDLSRWKRLAASQLFPIAQLSSPRPEGQRRRQQAQDWESPAGELAGNRRGGRLLFLAPAIVEYRHTAVMGQRRQPPWQRETFHSQMTRAGFIIGIKTG